MAKLRAVKKTAKIKVRRKATQIMRCKCPKCKKVKDIDLLEFKRDWCRECTQKHYWSKFGERILSYRKEQVKVKGEQLGKQVERRARDRKELSGHARQLMRDLLKWEASPRQIRHSFRLFYAGNGIMVSRKRLRRRIEHYRELVKKESQPKIRIIKRRKLRIKRKER